MALPPDGPQVRQPLERNVNKKTPASSWIGRLCFLVDGCVHPIADRRAQVLPFSALAAPLRDIASLLRSFTLWAEHAAKNG